MISDVGISLDHMLVINKINLGIENYEISKNHEDWVYFKRIMNIPVHVKANPSLNENVYKRADFWVHEQLYNNFKKTAISPSTGFPDRKSKHYKFS